jgi:hypothetical protein
MYCVENGEVLFAFGLLCEGIFPFTYGPIKGRKIWVILSRTSLGVTHLILAFYKNADFQI